MHAEPVPSTVDPVAEAELLLARGGPALALGALAKAPRTPDAWVLMAACADRLGRVAERRAFLDRAIAGGRGLVRRAAWLRALEALDRLEPVVATLGLSRAAAASPADAIRAGEASYGDGDGRGALDLLLQACRAAPDDPTAWSDVGVLLDALGQPEGAEAALKTALAADPRHRDARMNLARVCAAAERPADAAMHARRALKDHPGDPDARALLVELGVVDVGAPRAVIIARGVDTAPLRRVLRAAGYRPAELPIALVHAGLDLDPWLDGGVLVVAGDVDGGPAFEIATRKGIPAWKIDAKGDAPELPDDPAEAVAALAAVRTAAKHDEDLKPWLSIVVPTYDRNACLLNLLDRIALQRVDPRLFEVIVVDDGSPVPAEAATRDELWPFRLTVLRQPNAGPAKARNTGDGLARAPYVLWFNDDALPADHVVGGHILAQLAEDKPTAVLGTFDFIPEAQEHPFVAMLQRSSLLFQYVDMKPGEKNDWRYFYTCNLSVPRAALEAVGGFDEAYPHAICEDTELGFRLEKEQGVQVRYRPDLTAWHDHDLDVARYVKRQQLLGINGYRTWRKHGDVVAPWLKGAAAHGQRVFLGLRARVEQDEAKVATLVEKIAELERAGLPTGPDRERVLKELTAATALVSVQEYRRGLAAAAKGLSEKALRAPKPDLAAQKISVIVPNLNGFPHLVGMLDTLRATDTGPHELIFVDNGSDDGSREYLEQQPDVTVIALGRNLGAPTARNRGLAIATGELILFCDNDVLFTPGWRELLCDHLAAWPDVGMVGPSSDYVVATQKATVEPEPGEALDDYAARVTAAMGKGASRWCDQLILFFLLIRRDVIDAIGGIDEDFNPWGFEDNDYCLRARVAGFQPRIALDCFIRHLGSRSAKAAKLDYNALLLRNWETFKRKWDLDPALPYGAAWDGDKLPSYDRDRHFKAFRSDG